MSARFRQTFAALGGHVRPTDRSRERAINHEGTCFAVLALMLAAAAPTPTLAQAPKPPSADDLANPIKMGMMLEDDWTTAIGRLTIKQADQSVFDVYLGHLYREGAAEPAYIFETWLRTRAERWSAPGAATAPPRSTRPGCCSAATTSTSSPPGWRPGQNKRSCPAVVATPPPRARRHRRSRSQPRQHRQRSPGRRRRCRTRRRWRPRQVRHFRPRSSRSTA